MGRSVALSSYGQDCNYEERIYGKIEGFMMCLEGKSNDVLLLAKKVSQTVNEIV